LHVKNYESNGYFDFWEKQAKFPGQDCDTICGLREYIVFEHGPFNYEEESDTVGEKLQAAIDAFDFSKTDYTLNMEQGRIAYFYFVPESFEKRIQPVVKK
jgi:hypothetical protein